METANVWPLVPIGDVAKPVKRPEEPLPGTKYRQIGVRLWGVGAYERDILDGAETRYKALYRVEKGDIIVNKIWARNGSVAVVPAELANCYASGEFPLFVPDPQSLEPRWFHWITKTKFFWRQCDEKSHGTSGKNRIRPERFLEIEIPLPSLEEQRRIVARIEELAAKVEAAWALRQQAAEEAEALFGETVVELFTVQPGGNWQQYCLGDLTMDVRYGTSEKAHEEPLGTPVLRMGNIQDGRLDLADLKYLYLSDKEKNKLLLAPGEILVNRTNSAELVGKCAVFEEEGEYTFASYLIRLTLDSTKADPHLVAAYINSPSGRKYMFSKRKQMTGQANVNSKTLRSMPIDLPPLAEQRRIVAYLDALQAKVEAVKQHQAATGAALDALLPSILDRAFKGEL